MSTLSPDQLYEDDGSKLIALSSFLSICCIAVVVARFFAARKKKAGLWWDDWLCIPSLFFALSLNAINIVMVQMAGVGRHTASFGPETDMMLGRWGQILYVELLIYSFAVPLPKLVLLLFYVRIFSNRRFKIACYVVGAFVVAWCPAVFFTDVFQCSPIALAWDKSITSGTCINVLAFFRYIAIPVVLSDAVLLIMPLPMIWQLHMNHKQKLALSSVFLLGSLGLIASIARTVIFFQNDAFADPTWTAVTLLIWTMIEVEAVLIAACMPPLRPLFISFWQSTTHFTSKMSRSNKTDDSLPSYIGGSQKQGFTRFEDLGGIRRTCEVEMETEHVVQTPPPKGFV